MLYIFLSFLSGVFSGFLSIVFRKKELEKKIILMPKQLATQIAFFIACAFLFEAFFSQVSIDLGFIELSWIWIYVIFSSFSYYCLQVFYEFFSGNTLFATEQEMQEYLEKLENENDHF